MASGATPTDRLVKAGYWFCGSRYLIRSVEDMPSKLFTHLYAGFAEVNAIDGAVTVPEQYSDQFRDFTRTVRARSATKTLLSIGGEGSHISPVVVDEHRRQTFIRTSIELARSFDFDGLDLCWLYPSPADNADNLDSLLKDWRTAVTEDAQNRQLPDQLLLTAAVYHHPVIHGPDHRRSFNYPDISKYLDWINVLAIDFYTPSNSPKETGPVHGWRTGPTEPNRCGSHGIGNWIATINQSQKLVLGLPFYGYKWILSNPNSNGFFAPAHAATDKNPISYRNIPSNPPNDIETYLASYCLRNERNWFGFDARCDISGKVSEAIGDTNLGGYFAWHVGNDDDNWTLSHEAYNAANAVNP